MVVPGAEIQRRVLRSLFGTDRLVIDGIEEPDDRPLDLDGMRNRNIPVQKLADCL